MSFSGVLKITDGTKSVSLIATQTGVNLNEWIPAAPNLKNDGVWGNSPYTDGRILVSAAYNNILDTFQVKVTGATQDISIYNVRDLIQILVDMVDYSVDDWQLGLVSKPVWIEARSDCESETRYAYLWQWGLSIGSDPYDFPFKGSPSAIDECTLILEHGIWRDNAPNDADCLETYSYVMGPGGLRQVFEPIDDWDDAFADEDTVDIYTSPLEFGWDGGARKKKHVGIRFRDVTIPPGATIIDAYIEYTYLGTIGPGPSQNVTIYGEKDPHSAIFTTYANFMGRTRTTAFINTNGLPGLTIHARYRYLNLAGIVTEIINLAGWSSGHDMTFFLQGQNMGAGAGYEVFMNPVDDPAWPPPQLVITYLNGDVPYGISTPRCTETYAVGYHVNKQLSNVHVYVNSTNILGPNILNVQPSALVPAGPLAVGDRLYFGADFPFKNIVLNLASAGDGTVSYVWHYSTAGGPASGNLTNVVEHPFMLFSGLANTGTYLAEWDTVPYGGGWAKNVITDAFGIVTPSLYWVSIEITGITVPPVLGPSQILQPPYVTAWPFWETTAEEVGGDIDALLRFLLIQYEANYGTPVNVQDAHNHLLLGTRHCSRGLEFTPYLNCQYNQAGISNGVYAPSIYAASTEAPCGLEVQYVTAGTSAEAAIEDWTLTGAALTRQYSGVFRVFVRGYVTAGPGKVGFRCRFISPTGSFSTATIYAQTEVGYQTTMTLAGAGLGFDLVDLGTISFQAEGGLAYTSIRIMLTGQTIGAAGFNVTDLILFPVDETVLELYAISNLAAFSRTLGSEQLPFHDSTLPKEGPYSGMVRLANHDQLAYAMITKSLGSFTLENKTRMRIYFLPWTQLDGRRKGNNGVYDGRFERVQQYLLLRGDS